MQSNFVNPHKMGEENRERVLKKPLPNFSKKKFKK